MWQSANLVRDGVGGGELQMKYLGDAERTARIKVTKSSLSDMSEPVNTEGLTSQRITRLGP